MLLEPRYDELVRRSRATKDGIRFAVMLEPAGFNVGAKGRVCKIIETGLDSSTSAWRVLVEAGAACRVVELDTEEVQAGAEPLFLGKLAELAEEDLEVTVDMDQLGGTISAASEMVGILGVLGRNLQAVRHRWMMSALIGMLEEDNNSIEDVMQADREGLESMLGLMISYRQIISQMDRLLSDATITAERLSMEDGAESVEASEDEEELFRRLRHRHARPGETYAQRLEDSYRSPADFSPPASSSRAREINVRMAHELQSAVATLAPNSSTVNAATTDLPDAQLRTTRRANRNALPLVQAPQMSQAEALRRRGPAMGTSSGTAPISPTTLGRTSRPSITTPPSSQISPTGGTPSRTRQVARPR